MNRFLTLPWFAVLLTAVSAQAQYTAIPQAMVFSVGTSARDAGGQDWAFLLWAAPGADVLGDKAFAIYGKTGAADAPGTFTRESIVQGRLDPALLAPLLQRAELVGQDLAQFDKVIDGIYASAFHPAAAPALPNDRAQRTAIALSKAHTSRNLIGDLRTLSMMTPTLALCLGQAWVGPMPNGAMKTYELREWNAGSDGAVVGRVTLTGGAPVVLPAPARPVQVPDESEAADLTVRLRWGVPDELKRRIMLHQGFRVWRMSWGQAHALGYDTTPPTLAQLQAHIAANQVKLVTPQPLFLPSPMSPAQAEDLSFDPTRLYVTDDNDRFSDPAHYAPPADGTEMAYIVTPRDLLGRNGLPSLAGRGQFVLKKRPLVPRNAAVALVYGEANSDGVQPQSFRFTFDENTNDPANPTSGYEIYRGTGDMLDANGEPLGTNFLGVVQHLGTGAREWMDATSFPTGMQVWFIVRALRAGAAGWIRSDFSAPVYAALQDHQPPAAPQPVAAGSLCPQPGVVVAPPTGVVAGEAVEVNRFFHFRMVCDRLDQQIQWAQFTYVTDVGGGANEKTHTLDRIDFAGGDRVQMEFLLTDDDINNLSRFTCTTSDADDGHTATVTIDRPAEVMDLNQVYEVRFLTSMINPTSIDTANPVSEHFLDRANTRSADSLEITPGTSKGVAQADNVSPAPGFLVERRVGLLWTSVGFGARQDSTHIAFTDHTVNGPSSSPSAYRFVPLTNLQPCDETRASVVAATAKGRAGSVRVCLQAPPADSALEYRIYRRIDDGPLVLVAEGRPPSNAALICEEDNGLSVLGGTAIYYGQFVGHNGAGSPLARAKTVRITPATLPRPVAATPVVAGDADTPKVRLRWNCPPAGVDRFQITLKREASSTVSSGVASQYRQARKLRAPVTNSLLINYVPPEPIYSIVTDRIGSTPLGQGPAFTLDVEVDLDTRYDIWVNAVSGTNTTGPDSAVHSFEWKAPAAIVDAKVPWPFRALPEVVDAGFVALSVHPVPGSVTQVWPPGAPFVGVRIGVFPLWATPQYDTIMGHFANPPSLGLPHDTSIGPRLSPGIGRYLLRPDALGGKSALPAVLYRQQLPNSEWPQVSGDVIQVSPLITNILCTDDPDDDYQLLLRDPFIGVALQFTSNLDLGMYLIDTTPRAVGARYRYWMVRFNEDTGAPEFVIPATLDAVSP